MLSRRDFIKTTLWATGSVFLPAAPLHVIPYVQNVSRERASIVWQSSVNGFGIVQYSKDLSYSLGAAAQVRELLPGETGLPYVIYHYRADLENLSPSSEYRYRVFLDNSPLTMGDGFQFGTAGADTFDFLVFGDCGLGTKPQYDIAQRMLGEKAALALITGDVVYMSGSFAEYEERFFPYYGDMMKRVPFYPCPGNHDYLTHSLHPYLTLHALPFADVPPREQGRYYSFDWGNLHCVSLDTVGSIFDAVSGRGKMLEWLEQDLDKSNRFWRIVFFHHPPYATGIHETDASSGFVRQYILPILDRYKVDVAFAGHEHSYQRTYPIRAGNIVESGEGTVHVTTGGGGGDLYPIYSNPKMAFGESAYHYVRAEIRGTHMTVRAIRIDGKEIDTFALSPPPTICSSFLSPRDASRVLEWDRPIVTIYGRHLAGDERQTKELPLPRTLAGTRVTLNGRPLPLLSVSDTKIEAQLPHLRASARLGVETPNGSAETDVVFSMQPGERICP